jgi:oligopeptidase B
LDFKDCAKYLIAEGIYIIILYFYCLLMPFLTILLRIGLTSSDLLCASGNSAGGLLMGVMMNNFSDLFRAFVMRNPFLDIANSVTDADSPLTIHEYDEWGDVHSEGNANTNPSQILKYIQSYSPHSNINELSLSSVNPRVLPSVLITVGIQDDRVDPEQSLQWMQLLREKYKQLDAGNSPALLLNIRNEGHDGAATVEEQGHVEAIELAFLEKETRSD